MKNKFLPALMLAFFALTACGKDTQKEVDNANRDQARMVELDKALSEDRVYVLLPSVSERSIRLQRTDPEALARLEALLSEYVSRASNVLSTAQNPDVNYNAEVLTWLPRKIAQAQTMLKQVRRERKVYASL